MVFVIKGFLALRVETRWFHSLNILRSLHPPPTPKKITTTNNFLGNYEDALLVDGELANLAASVAFATNGDQFFARPGPKLLTGVVVMALCSYWDQPKAWHRKS